MNLLLDEDSSRRPLAGILRKFGHNIETVSELARTGDADEEVFAYAILQNRVLISRNRDDFDLLHMLILTSNGHHPGVIIEERANNPRLDMTPRGIAVAIGKLEASGFATADQFITINHWR